jgi:ribosomal protein S12 methylthiotransferase accessory factor YcaO
MMLEIVDPTVDARERPSEATPTFEGDTIVAIEKLRRVGLSRVLTVDLSRSDFPINVVKVVVPDLEGYTFANYQSGPRARAFDGRAFAS